MTLSLTWSFIMAAGIVVGLAVFLFLVARAAGRRGQKDPPQESMPRREVIGGRFDAAGGRQVMPRRDAPPAEKPAGEPSSQDHRR